CATAGMASPQITYRMNNRISSIRLFGSAEVTVYQEYNFTGRSRTIGSDLDDLRRGGWNDRITSYRVRATGRGPNDWSGRWGRPTTPAAGACFYEHINFEGEYFCVRQGDRVAIVTSPARRSTWKRAPAISVTRAGTTRSRHSVSRPPASAAAAVKVAARAMAVAIRAATAAGRRWPRAAWNGAAVSTIAFTWSSRDARSNSGRSPVRHSPKAERLLLQACPTKPFA